MTEIQQLQTKLSEAERELSRLRRELTAIQTHLAGEESPVSFSPADQSRTGGGFASKISVRK